MIFSRAFTFSARDGSSKPPKPYRGEAISGPLDARPVGDYLMETVADSPADMGTSDGRPSTADEDFSSTNQQDHSESTTAQSSAIITRNAEPNAETSPKTRTAQQLPPIQIPMGRTRTIQISEPCPNSALHHRQRLRERSRGMSFARSPLSQPPMTGPPRRSTGVSTYSADSASRHHIPSPVQHQHTGLGGFPSPIQLIGHVLPERAVTTMRHRLGRPERRHTLLLSRQLSINRTDTEQGDAGEESWDSVKAAVARWMPERLGGLVIGRNSRFFSEELDDEELEELGGVEYRALRLLSYLVPAVSPAAAFTGLTDSTLHCSSSSPSPSSRYTGPRHPDGTRYSISRRASSKIRPTKRGPRCSWSRQDSRDAV